MELKKVIRLSMLISLSVVISIIESYIPILNNVIPGLRLGLSNIIILFVLYKYSFKDSLYVSIVRVFLVGLLRTGIFSISFFFSLSGAIFSIIFMYLVKKIKLFSVVGVSIVGSVTHSIGQILIAIFILNNENIIYYLPYLLIFSIPTGIITGIITNKILKYDINI